jgi:hypothetical protein
MRMLRSIVLAVRFVLVLSPAVGLVESARGQTVHFLVAERPEFASNGDSYVLPLTDPADIAYARALITAPPGDLSSIVVANIAPGADGVNRDHLAPGDPPWSWHVSSFVEFADITAEILDGWPSFVEEDVAGWIANTGGMVGFWNYTVIEELAAVPEPSTAACGLMALTLIAAVRRPTRG